MCDNSNNVIEKRIKKHVKKKKMLFKLRSEKESKSN